MEGLFPLQPQARSKDFGGDTCALAQGLQGELGDFGCDFGYGLCSGAFRTGIIPTPVSGLEET